MPMRWRSASAQASNRFAIALAGTGRRSDADMLYAWKVAPLPEGEEYCMEVQELLTDPSGEPYDCPDLDLETDEMFFIFRSYMEPATRVSPDDNELLYDQAIYFGPGDFFPPTP
jgi:hypothetical protein